MFAAKTATVTCNYENKKLDTNRQKQKIQKLAKIDPKVSEGSGLCASPLSENLLTINDSGDEAVVYEINKKGKLINSTKIPQAKNKDWEEITNDEAGNIFIGDFGNNNSNRKDLCIYKYNGKTTAKISFEYADQNSKSEYDCEAFFWYNNQLYLFTKSWEKGLKKCRLYSLPDEAGHYKITAKDSVLIKSQVTGAAINPSENTFALITYGKILTFKIENGISFNKPEFCIKIGKSQTEAIMFESDSTILFSNEQGKLFQIEI